MIGTEPSRVAVVTGGNRGIGREVVRQLADRDHIVVLCSRDDIKGRAAAAELDPGGERIVLRQLDVTDPGSVARMAQWVSQTLGRVDVLINNAAISYDTGQFAVDADLPSVRVALETNLFGVWRTTQSLLPLLKAGDRSRIVNVSSEGGSISQMTGGTPAYSLSKAALNALTRLLAGELAADRVLVNAVCPGWVDTDMGGRGGRPVTAGAAGVVWAAMLDDDGPTGGFFRDGRPLRW